MMNFIYFLIGLGAVIALIGLLFILGWISRTVFKWGLSESVIDNWEGSFREYCVEGVYFFILSVFAFIVSSFAYVALHGLGWYMVHAVK